MFIADIFRKLKKKKTTERPKMAGPSKLITH